MRFRASQTRRELPGTTSGMGHGWAAAHCNLETPVPARNVEFDTTPAPSARKHELAMQISRRSMLARVDIPRLR
jgi:hypothetical protein